MTCRDDDPHWREAALRYLRAIFTTRHSRIKPESAAWNEIMESARQMMRFERAQDMRQ